MNLKMPFSSTKSILPVFSFVALSLFGSQQVLAQPAQVSLSEVKVLTPDEWDSDKRDKLKLLLNVESENDNLEVCGVTFTGATTNTGEVLEPSFGFEDENALLFDRMETGYFSKSIDVALYSPSKKAEKVTFEGSLCVFLPSNSGEQKLVIEDILSHSKVALKNPILASENLSLGFFTEKGFKASFDQAKELADNLSDDKTAMKDAFIKQHGDDLGTVFTNFFDTGYISGNIGDINIIGTGNLSRITKLELQGADASALQTSQKGGSVVSGPEGVIKMLYVARYHDTPPADARLVIHLANEQSLLQIPFTLEVAVPKK